MVRDIVILLTTRWLFSQTIFHFHAGGLSEILPRLPRWARLFSRVAYFKPDICIRAGVHTPDDCSALHAAKSFIVPYGIEDIADGKAGPQDGRLPRLLFVGLLRESKGVQVLLEACSTLRRAGYAFELLFVGQFETQKFEAQVHEFVEQEGLRSIVRFAGILTDDAKSDAYASADIFCFPSYYESEALPIVLIEAMLFGLPIVASEWRGIPDLVSHGENGLLVPPRDPRSVADAIGRLIRDPDLRRELGDQARARYEKDYSLSAYHARLQAVFDAL